MSSKASKEALALWQRIAEGERGEELDAWIRGVAASIVKDIFLARFDVPARRAEKALTKIGFSGKAEQYPELDALINDNPDMSNPDLEWIAKVVDIKPLPEGDKALKNAVYNRKAKLK